MDRNYQYLVGKLQEALAVDARVSALDVKITVLGGKIHLTGEVGTEERRRALTDVVNSVLPGTQVYNEVTVLGMLDAPKLERIHG
jgi:osmotically-inducible protein OsmY